MEVPPMNTVVTDPGETVIAADAVPHRGGRARNITADKRGSARDATAHQRIASNATTHKRLAGNATVHKCIAARHSARGKAGTSAEAVSAARGTAAEMTAAASAMTTASATSAMRGHRAGWNRRHTQRNRCHQCNSEPTQHDTFLLITFE